MVSKEIYFELYNITIRQNRKIISGGTNIQWTVKFTADDRAIINYKPLQLYPQ